MGDRNNCTFCTPLKRPEFIDQLEDFVDCFSFGSNIYPPDKFHKRGQKGSGIEFECFEPAYVKGYRLAFNLKFAPPLEPSFVSLEPLSNLDPHVSAPAPGATIQDSSTRRPPSTTPTTVGLDFHLNGEVHGSLIRMKRTEYDKLWESEGGMGIYYQPYREIPVQCYTYGGRIVPAVALQSTEYLKSTQEHVSTSLRYVKLIQDGARKAHIRENYIHHVLDRIPCIPPPNTTVLLKISQLALSFFFYLVTSTSLRPGRPIVLRCVQALLFGIHELRLKMLGKPQHGGYRSDYEEQQQQKVDVDAGAGAGAGTNAGTDTSGNAGANAGANVGAGADDVTSMSEKRANRNFQTIRKTSSTRSVIVDTVTAILLVPFGMMGVSVRMWSQLQLKWKKSKEKTADPDDFDHFLEKNDEEKNKKKGKKM